MIDYADGNHGSLYPRKEQFSQEGVCFVTATDLADGRVDFLNVQKLDSEKAKQLKKGWATAGDILFSHNATVGRVAIVDESTEPFLLRTSVTYYRLNSNWLLPRFLYWAFQSPIFVQQYEAIMEQTTRNQVPISRQAFLELPIPPKHEQLEVVRRIERALNWIDRLREEHRVAVRLIDRTERVMLKSAFMGELTSQEILASGEAAN